MLWVWFYLVLFCRFACSFACSPCLPSCQVDAKATQIESLQAETKLLSAKIASLERARQTHESLGLELQVARGEQNRR